MRKTAADRTVSNAAPGWKSPCFSNALLLDHLHDHLSLGMPLFEVGECIGDLRERINTVNDYLEPLLIDEGSQF